MESAPVEVPPSTYRDRIIMPRSPSSLLAAVLKVALDQVFMAPLGLAVFFISIKVRL